MPIIPKLSQLIKCGCITLILCMNMHVYVCMYVQMHVCMKKECSHMVCININACMCVHVPWTIYSPRHNPLTMANGKCTMDYGPWY